MAKDVIIVPADGSIEFSGSSGNYLWTVDNNGAVTASATTLVTNLNADLLDGQHSTDFLRELSTGTEANIDTYDDNGFRVISYSGFSKQLWSVNSGGSVGTIQIEFDYSTATRGFRVRNKTGNTTWTAWGNVVMASSNQGYITGTVWHSNNDGAGSGLDADLLDGYHVGTSGSTIPLLNTANTWSATQTINGQLNIDNLRLDGNTLSATSGDVILGSATQFQNLWNSTDLTANSFFAQNATDGFAFGVGGNVSTWFSWDSVEGQNRAIDVWNDGSLVKIYRDTEVEGNLNVSTNTNTTGARIFTRADSGEVLRVDKASGAYALVVNQDRTLIGGYLDVDNIRIDGNTISSTDINGDILLDPDGTGNVGIGTSSPSAKLHVSGSLQVDDNVTFAQALTVQGNLTVLGSQFSASVETVLIQDNILVLNDGESGAGVTAGFAGIEIDRGSENPFWFTFRESDDRFVVGVSSSFQVVATREDDGDMQSFGVPYFDGTNKRFNTDSGFVYSGSNVGIGTTSPSYKLDIVDGDLRVVKNSGNAQINIEGSSTGFPLLSLIDTEAGGVTWNIENGREGDGYLGFYRSGGGTKVIIDTNGSVGIGTTSPTHRLTVFAPLNDSTETNGFFVGTGSYGVTISNTTGTGFIPLLKGNAYDTGDEGLYIIGNTPNGSTANSVRISLRENNALIPDDRNIFQIDNFTTTLFALRPNTAYFSGKLGIGLTSSIEPLGIYNASSPRMYFTDGTNTLYTGIWSSAGRLESNGLDFYTGTTGADDFHLTTNSSTRIFINSSGQVGIGTTTVTTSNKLRVLSSTYTGAISQSAFLFELGDDSTFQNPTAIMHIKNSGNRGSRGNANGSNLLKLDFTDVTAMVVNKDGDVGIGTDSPTSVTNYTFVTINNSGNGGGIIMQESGTDRTSIYNVVNDMYYDATDEHFFRTGGAVGGTTVMTISGSNVGIGTSTPSDRLTIDGNNVSEGLRITRGSEDSGQSLKLHTDGGVLFLDGVDTSRAIGTFGYNFYFRQIASDGTFTRMAIDSSGNVGMGVTSTSNRLHVSSSAGGIGTSAIRAETSLSDTFIWGSEILAPNMTANQNVVHFMGKQFNTRNAGYIGFNWVSDQSTSNFLTFGLFGVDNIMNINGSGYVGIGITSPDRPLHIYNATSDAPLKIESGDAVSGLTLEDPNGSDSLYYVGSTNSWYFNSGKVGIGTTSPAEKLEIRTTGASGAAGTLGLRIQNDTANSWSGIEFRRADNDYAGYLLIKNDSDNGTIYTADGITLVADRGALNFATRNTSSPINFYTGATPVKRMFINSGGDLVLTSSVGQQLTNIQGITGTGSVATLSLGSDYTTAFFDYVISSGSAQRAGTVVATYNSGASSVEFTDYGTRDINNASDVSLSADFNGGNIRLIASAPNEEWTIKTVVRGL